MINLGPKSAGRLVAVGIEDAEALHQVGAAAAYHRVEARFPDTTSLNLLWGYPGRTHGASLARRARRDQTAAAR
ncbi:MAG: hypothetical protein F4X40_06130 [Chloroflexi bacterium]|nr:hypothetical protein [Chloroflexota bacterium]